MKPIKCENEKKQLSVHQDRQLSVEAARALEAHVAGCAECAGERRAYAALEGLLPEYHRVSLHEGFNGKVWQALSSGGRAAGVSYKGEVGTMQHYSVKQKAENQRSFLISAGIHALLLLLLFNVIVVKRAEIKTPTFIAKVVSMNQVKPKVKKEPLLKERQPLPQANAGSEGATGMMGGGRSSPKLAEKLMVAKEETKTKTFVPNKPTAISNISREVRELFTPKRVLTVANARMPNQARVNNPNVTTSANNPASASKGQVRNANSSAANKSKTGMKIAGNDEYTGTPMGASGTGIGNDAGGTTGVGGGDGIGFMSGSGTGSGNYGSGSGGGSTGLGNGTGPGTGIGPGAGPGAGVPGAPGAPGNPGSPIGGPTGPGGPTNPVNPTQPVVPQPKPPLGSPGNRVTKLEIRIDIAGDAAADHTFGMQFPEQRDLIPNAKFSRSESLNLDRPYETAPENFIFFLRMSYEGQTWTHLSTDMQQVRVDQRSEDTIRLYWEDLPPSMAPDFDYNDVVVTIRFIGEMR